MKTEYEFSPLKWKLIIKRDGYHLKVILVYIIKFDGYICINN